MSNRVASTGVEPARTEALGFDELLGRVSHGKYRLSELSIFTRMFVSRTYQARISRALGACQDNDLQLLPDVC